MSKYFEGTWEQSADSGEQFEIPFKGKSKNNFGNKGDSGIFLENTGTETPLGGLYIPKIWPPQKKRIANLASKPKQVSVP